MIEAIDAHAATLRLKVCCSSIYGEAVFTPDGQTIANAGHWPGLWDARSGQLIGRLTANREFYTFGPIAFDASRDAILMGSQDGRVYTWDLKTRQLIAVSPPQPAYVDTLAISTTGWVIFAGFGKDTQLWNPETGQRRSLPPPQHVNTARAGDPAPPQHVNTARAGDPAAAQPTSNLVLGPDGASIIFGTADGNIEFWDVRTEQRLRAMKIPGPKPLLVLPKPEAKG